MPNDHKKLHLACGEVIFPGWLNIDLDSPKADMHLDFTKPLPFPDGSLTHIYSEHFIEHMLRPEAVCFLAECRRVLSVNGVVRISTPNLRFLIAAYLSRSKDEWGELWAPETLCLLMNEGMRSWGHQFVYDFDELTRVLIEAGFTSLSFQEYGKSKDKELCGLESRPFHNEIIVEARKTEDAVLSVDDLAVKKYEGQWPIRLESDMAIRLKTAEQKLADRANHFKPLEKPLYRKIISRLSRLFLSPSNGH